MSMISNSRADRPARWSRLAGLAVLAACLHGCDREPPAPPDSASEIAPDAPREALPPAGPAAPPEEAAKPLGPTELQAAWIRELDAELEALAGSQFLSRATAPLAVEVQAQEPFDPTPRTSWPVIVLNGQKLKNTRGLRSAPDKLVAFLPDHKLIQEINSVEVVWIGNEDSTRTQSPVRVEAKDIVRADR